MSRTGNLLFPDDQDDGWVASIQKALPKDDPKNLKIEDPVAIEAEAAFAEIAAETATREAINAASWSAETVPFVPPRPEEGLSPEALAALDALIDRAYAREASPAAAEDPVADAASAAFAETAAETAAREALDAAGWSAETVRPDEGLSPEERAALDAAIAREDAKDGPPDATGWSAEITKPEPPAREALDAAGWSAETVRSAPSWPDEGLSPEESAALEAEIDREYAKDGLPAAAESAPQEAVNVGGWLAETFRSIPSSPEDGLSPAESAALDAMIERRDAESAAETATQEAIKAARWSAETAKPETPSAEDAEPEILASAAELDALDDEIANQALLGRELDTGEDPVAIEAEAAFAERAADLAVSDAIFAAGWAPQTVPPGAVVAAAGAPGRPPGLGFWEIEDLVRAEAEIAFEDAAYDFAYSAVDNLVTGEAVALAAFDRAIAAGADPEEALAAAIQAAEAVDPFVFGVAQVATGPFETDELAFLDQDPAEPVSEPEEKPGDEAQGEPDREAEAEDEDEPEDEPEILTGGEGFDTVTGQQLLLGADGSETLAGTGVDFLLDLDLISVPGSGFRRVERDDLIILPTALLTAVPIAGTAAADFILGDDGANTIGGREGDDFIYGDVPTNFISGTHNIGNPLTDPVFSGAGDRDAISGGAGSDTIWGGPGDDSIHGDVPDTSSSLAAEFTFSLGTDTAGDDEIHGGDGDDTLFGGGGDDTLYGDDGKDTLEGNDGADTLYGGAGADNIFGYAGDDILIGGEGDDTLTGGGGADQFVFEGGSGVGALAHATSLGTDTIADYSAADGDTFGLSDADFGLGAAGTLTDGADYFESAAATLSLAPLDASGGTANAGIVVLGDGAGTDGVQVYYTDDASAMTTANSYQIADITGANTSQIDAGDFTLRA
ncbi:MAG: hypothetical protein IIC56_08960 [Proteobacteria bacterium]|nr:hypothetical protein [Pseudomonadota bacterium]